MKDTVYALVFFFFYLICLIFMNDDGGTRTQVAADRARFARARRRVRARAGGGGAALAPQRRAHCGSGATRASLTAPSPTSQFSLHVCCRVSTSLHSAYLFICQLLPTFVAKALLPTLNAILLYLAFFILCVFIKYYN